MNNIGLNFNYGKQEISQKGVNKASQETVEKKDVSLDEVYKPENPNPPKPPVKALFKGKPGESFTEIKDRLAKEGVVGYRENDRILEYDEDGHVLAIYYYRKGKWHGTHR